MTYSEADELYMWLAASWPLTIRPNATEEFRRVKTEELRQSFAKYSYTEVGEAFYRWKMENEKFPSVKNIINEIEWLRKKNQAQGAANPDDYGWPMEIVYADGHEACYGVFNRQQFINHAKNPEHLQPEEWRRRFMKRRQQIYKRQQEEARA